MPGIRLAHAARGRRGRTRVVIGRVRFSRFWEKFRTEAPHAGSAEDPFGGYPPAEYALVVELDELVERLMVEGYFEDSAVERLDAVAQLAGADPTTGPSGAAVTAAAVGYMAYRAEDLRAVRLADELRDHLRDRTLLLVARRDSSGALRTADGRRTSLTAADLIYAWEHGYAIARSLTGDERPAI